MTQTTSETSMGAAERLPVGDILNEFLAIVNLKQRAASAHELACMTERSVNSLLHVSENRLIASSPRELEQIDPDLYHLYAEQSLLAHFNTFVSRIAIDDHKLARSRLRTRLDADYLGRFIQASAVDDQSAPIDMMARGRNGRWVLVDQLEGAEGKVLGFDVNCFTVTLQALRKRSLFKPLDLFKVHLVDDDYVPQVTLVELDK